MSDRPRHVVMILACLAAKAASAQSSVKAPDKFTEALVYAGYAEDAFLCKDADVSTEPVSAAQKWTMEALSTVSQFKTDDPLRETRAAQFVQREKAQLDVLKKWERTLRELPKTVENALRGGRLMSAETMVNDPGAPSCDPTLRRLKEVVADQRQRFDALVREGDSLDGPAALDKYKAAQKLNREDVELATKIRTTARKK